MSPLVVSLALAEEPVPTADVAAPAPGVAVSSTGELRAIGSLPPDLVVDTDGTRVGQGFVLDTRARLGLAAAWRGWRAATEADLFDAQAAGDAWDVPGSEDARHRERVSLLEPEAFGLRRLAIDGRVGPLGVEAGLVTSHWGLGMVANDGAHDLFFGRSDFGDRVLRVRLASRPFGGGQFPLTLILAGDRVVEDDSADWGPIAGGDAAFQGVAAALYDDGKSRKLGIYGVFRHQEEEELLSTGEARSTDAGVLDLYGDVTVRAGPCNLRLATEAAAILGRTDRAQSYGSPEGLDLRSGGITALAALSHPDDRDRLVVRAGWASGDADPDDEMASDFAFDRDFDVGMVLFKEVLGAVDAAAYAQISDPENAGAAPWGAEALVTEGAFRRATFVQPLLGGKPLPWLDLSAGALFAWATAPIQQPFATTRNGGVPTNFLGEETSGYALGTEVDWAVKVGDVPMGKEGLLARARPALLVQGGHLFASDNLGGGAHTLLTATGRLRW